MASAISLGTPALVMAPETPTIDTFKGNPHAQVTEFFKVWNRDLTPDLVARNEKICNLFLSKYGRTRFSSFFQLLWSQACEVVGEVCGEGNEGWDGL